MPITYPYIQYGGIWTTSQATDAVAAGTWAVPPTPKLFVWGLNNKGQLGLGNINYTNTSPLQLGTLTDWVQVACAYKSTAAIKKNGTLWTWGENNYGQLGLNNTTQYESPKQVGALTNWSNVDVGSFNFMSAIKTDGTLWTWGRNNYGQLGLGNGTDYSSPKQVGASSDWAKVYCGFAHVLAIKTNGTLWSWGLGAHGALGLGNTTYYSSPKQVGALTNWSSANCGYQFTLATKTDGTLWSWGYNPYGQLGLGNNTYYSSPKQVGSLTDWIKTACGTYSSFAIKIDDTLWSWGRNNYGQLGIGNTTPKNSPTQVGASTDWAQVSGGGYFAGAIKTDGTLWMWGQGDYATSYGGQLGLGNILSYSSPKQVGSLTSWSSISLATFSSFGIAATLP